MTELEFKARVAHLYQEFLKANGYLPVVTATVAWQCKDGPQYVRVELEKPKT